METTLDVQMVDENNQPNNPTKDASESKIDLHELVNAIIDKPDFWNSQRVDNM